MEVEKCTLKLQFLHKKKGEEDFNSGCVIRYGKSLDLIFLDGDMVRAWSYSNFTNLALGCALGLA